MNKRGRHVGKSMAARETYSRYIKKIDCEATVDDKIELSPSTEGGEELREPTSKRRRKVSVGRLFRTHLEEHWVEWLFGSVIAMTAWLMVGARLDLVRIDTTAGAQKDCIIDLQSGAQKSVDKNQEQDLLLREHSIRISNVEEKVNKAKK